jgi:hypothetical protein
MKQMGQTGTLSKKDVSNAVVFGSRWHQTDKLIRNYRDTIMIQLKLKT